MDESRPLPAFRCEQIEGGRLAKEWQEWKGSLQCYFDSYEITDQKLMRAKMLHLGGPQLQKVFRSLDGTEDFPEELVEKPWYDAAIDKLDAYFKPRRQDVLERHKLRNMKQAPNERFAHFVLRLRQQMQDCGFEKYRPKVRRIIEEMLMIDVIVEGCASQDLRRKILAKDQTLAEIEAMGESIESVLIQEKELGKGSDSGRSAYSEVCKITKDKGSRRQAHFESRSKDEEHCPWTCFACGRRGHKAMDKECPANGRNCNKCNAIGHFGLRCPKSKRSFKQEISEQPSKKIRSVEASDNRSEEMDTKKVYYTFYGGNTSNVVEVNIGGVSTEMLVDSGSDANLITSKTWQKLKFRQVELLSCRKGGNKILRSYASEVPLVILGTFQAVVMVGELSTEAEFFVVENGQRDLIGDFTSKRLGILKGAYWYLDDVGIVGDTVEEHDARLNKVLKRFEDSGVVLNWTKCKVRVTEFDFLGYRFSPHGIRPSLAKQEAVLSFRRPENESEVRSFLGLANYMGKFVHDLATIDEPLRKLTQKGTKFEWGDQEEAAFVEIKGRIANAQCLGPEPEFVGDANVGELEENGNMNETVEEGPSNSKRKRCEPNRFKDYIPY
ncbi:hypothetical protein pipiens_015325 [Culex pipiens pipiens]|uniref:RNA-directed DNA polymerase n=1 Tax=Culex pipiens pipiens TaxID=38569 RepID=A0ABD1CQX9_CULPP